MLRYFIRVWLFVTPRAVAHQAPLSMGFSRQKYWSGLSFPSSRDLPDPGIKTESTASPALQADTLPLSQWGSPFHRYRLSIWFCGFNLQHLQLMERFLFLFLTCSSPGAQLWFYPHLCIWTIHRSLTSRLPCRTWVCSSEDRAWRWHGYLDFRDPGSTRCAGKPVTLGAGDMALLGVFPNLWKLAIKEPPCLVLLYC